MMYLTLVAPVFRIFETLISTLIMLISTLLSTRKCK